jgi:hypothetical protein
VEISILVPKKKNESMNEKTEKFTETNRVHVGDSARKSPTPNKIEQIDLS